MINGRGPLVVLDFVVPPEELERRLTRDGSAAVRVDDGRGRRARVPRCAGELGQRSDDGVDVVRKRLQVYERDTMPLFEYYRSRGRCTASTATDRRPKSRRRSTRRSARTAARNGRADA